MNVKSWINVTLLLALLATLLQIAGYVAPMWIWLEVDSFLVGIGLWFTTGCGLDNSCNTTAPTLAFGYSADDTFNKPQYNAVRGLETIGLAAGILLLLFLVVYRVGYGRWTHLEQLNFTAFIASIITWLCILAGLIVFCAYYWPVVGTSPILNRESFPWSLLMCLFAAFFYIIVCVLIRVKCRDRDYLKHAIPTSGDSKMDLNPVTKQGILHRYFTPLHYNEKRRMNFAIGGGYTDEGTVVPGMTRRLIGPEERHVTSVDNIAFQGNRLENGVSYRYLSAGQNGMIAGAQQADNGVRHTLPTAIVTYADTAANNSNLLNTRADVNPYNHTNRQDGGPNFYRSASTGSLGQQGALMGRRLMRQNSADQIMYAGRESAYAGRDAAFGGRDAAFGGRDAAFGGRDAAFGGRDAAFGGRDAAFGGRDVAIAGHVDSAFAARESPFTGRDSGYQKHITSDSPYNQAAGGIAQDGVAYQGNLNASPRGGDAFGASRDAAGGYITYTTVTRPVVTSSTSYVKREVTRETRLADNNMDARYTNEGRLTADADYIATEQRRSGGGLGAQSGVSSQASGGLLGYTTHTGMGQSIGTRSLFPIGSSITPYDPTYIYRPYSEQQIY
ncbi:uncharacterized protein [Littorina saxatilis]|uniref:Uncharacterized protein n=1 Tax=Littorina saxatilis TaxID=31220 RepID=A0AAN9BYC0_9CAEN